MINALCFELCVSFQVDGDSGVIRVGPVADAGNASGVRGPVAALGLGYGCAVSGRLLPAGSLFLRAPFRRITGLVIPVVLVLRSQSRLLRRLADCLAGHV